MDQLYEQLNKLLADTYAYAIKLQFFHWNVEGANFYNDHLFFATMYEEVYGAVDPIAEHIRAVDGFAAGSLIRFSQLTSIPDQVQVVQGPEMFKILARDNDTIISNLQQCVVLADRFNQIGLSDFLQDRIDKHAKHGWMLRVTTRGVTS